MSSGQGECLPIFDVEDAQLVGWEWGQADDGDFVVQARCAEHGCAHALKFPPGAFLDHDPPGEFRGEGVQFHGPMRPPPVRELPS
jgi:hypothetical protein